MGSEMCIRDSVLASECFIAAYADMLGAGGASAWTVVPGGYPRPLGYDSGFANVNCAVQLLHRLLPVALWLEKHAALCGDEARCIVCALRRCRDGMGQRHSGVLVRGDDFKPEPGGWQGSTCAEYFVWLTERLRARERDVAGVCVSRTPTQIVFQRATVS